MDFRLIYHSARFAVLEMADGGVYNTKEAYELFLNGESRGAFSTVITPVYDLLPDTEYRAELKKDGVLVAETAFRTAKETVTLNVRDFGAAGDGVKDDTLAIQTAILCCPPGGRVLIPAGTYSFVCLHLKDNIDLELAEGAELSATVDRDCFPYLPGMVRRTDDTDDYQLGTWEGDPQRMFCGLLTGIGVKHVNVYGKGTLNGNAGHDNWWHNCKQMVTAWRPRAIFLNGCEDVSLVGITVKNSPSWTIHPYFSNHLRFLALDVLNPKDSHNRRPGSGKL